jgi:hypothetical protein
VLPWEVKAQATFNAQPVATAIAAAARPFKRERDLSSQKSTTGSKRAVSNRAVVANFSMMSPNVSATTVERPPDCHKRNAPFLRVHCSVANEANKCQERTEGKIN